MDPDAALKEARDMAAYILSEKGAEIYTAIHMAEAFQTLDDWISKGGFLPKDWQK